MAAIETSCHNLVKKIELLTEDCVGIVKGGQICPKIVEVHGVNSSSSECTDFLDMQMKTQDFQTWNGMIPNQPIKPRMKS